MGSEPKPRVALNGWKEISVYLGIGQRTAQEYEKDAGLPIRRMPGAKGRVFAYADELDKWKQARLNGSEEQVANSSDHLVVHANGPDGLQRPELGRTEIRDLEVVHEVSHRRAEGNRARRAWTACLI